MKTINKQITIKGSRIILTFLAASTLALAQNPADNGGWRRVDDPPPPPPAYSDQDQNRDPRYSSQAPYPNQGPYPNQAPYPGQQGPYRDQPPPAGNYAGNYSVPPQLTIQPGTFVTVRVNQPLSSDRNHPGDAFSATLVRPVVVDGVVIAQRGQTIGGRVVEAVKAGRVEGVSRLGIQLTDLSLVDGQQVPIHSQFISRSGPTSVGDDVGAVAATTGVGAAIGAGVNGGVGAGVGAAAGLVAGIAGVMLTRGHQTIIHPESVLTFRIEAPVTIATDRAPQAFRYMDPREYERPYDMQARMGGAYPEGPGYGYPAPPPPYYGYGYGYPYYAAPGFSFYYGPGFATGYVFGPRFYGGGRFYGGRGYVYGHRR
jgi:hypothetical protein